MNNSTEHARRVSVLVVDDSAFMRTALTRMIESDPALRIAGTAQNGMQALERIVDLQPDVVTLDVEMPGLNGLETLKRIMQEFPRPVIMVSSLTQDGAESTLEALEIGAFDYVSKQESFASLDVVKIREDLIAKIRAAAELNRRRTAGQIVNKACIHQNRCVPHFPGTTALVALGTSTGGPKALQQMLPLLPRDLAVGVLVVQHMPVGIYRSIREPAEPALPDGGERGNPRPDHRSWRCLHCTRRTAPYRDTPKFSESCCPAFRLTRGHPSSTLCGRDDAFRGGSIWSAGDGRHHDRNGSGRCPRHEGDRRKAGGLTVGQDEASCTVYGMPRSCAEAGVLQRVVSLTQIPGEILQATHYHEHH